MYLLQELPEFSTNIRLQKENSYRTVFKVDHFCLFPYKRNLELLLLQRADKTGPSYKLIHNDFTRIRDMLAKNGYPRTFVDDCIRGFYFFTDDCIRFYFLLMMDIAKSKTFKYFTILNKDLLFLIKVNKIAVQSVSKISITITMKRSSKHCDQFTYIRSLELCLCRHCEFIL